MSSSPVVVLSDDEESGSSHASSHEYTQRGTWAKRQRFSDPDASSIWSMLHPNLRYLEDTPGMKQLQTAMGDDRFRFDFATSINAGDILAHAAGVVLNHLKYSQRYKIGFTHLPHSRFYKVFQDTPFEGLGQA